MNSEMNSEINSEINAEIPPKYHSPYNHDVEVGSAQRQQGNVVYVNQAANYEYDNSACLYCSACLSLFFPFVGIIVILFYLLGCMQPNRSQRERIAFAVLLIATVINVLFITISIIVAEIN